MPRHTSKAHAKYETETKIVLVAADLTFYGITVTPLFLCESLSLPTRSFEENMSNNVRSYRQ